MTWIQLPDAFINLDQVRRVEFEDNALHPYIAVIAWAGGSADESSHSILEGKNATCLKEALDRLSVEFTEPIQHYPREVEGELIDQLETA